MDNERKVTYSVIAGLVVLLGGLAYFLQPLSGRPTDVNEEGVQSTTTQQLTTSVPKNGTPILSTMEDKKYTSATITTNKGVIEITFGDKTPATIKNFSTLASTNFYNGVRFHRIIKGFMIQTGDPLSKDKANEASWGTGGPGYKFADELAGNEQYPQGTVAMANSGPNTNGSQFFIVTANPGAPLPPSYTVFGKVTKGMETALAIENVKTGVADRPVEDVIVEKIQVR